MSHNSRFGENGNGSRAVELRGEPTSAASSSAARSAEIASVAGRYPDLQSAMRFPIKLPIFVKSKSGESYTETENISANGVLFQMDQEVPVGSPVEFTISLPAAVVGAENDVRVDCRGRVVRNINAGGRVVVGVVIDEYHFERGERSQEN
jgi:hypothetical protein